MTLPVAAPAARETWAALVGTFRVVRVGAGVPVAAPVGSGAGVSAAGSGLVGSGRTVDLAEAEETDGTVATTITTGAAVVANELDGAVDADVAATDGVELVATEEPMTDEPVAELPVDAGLEPLVTELPVIDPEVTIEPEVTDEPDESEVTDESDEAEGDDSDDAEDDPDDSLEAAELGSLDAAVDSSEPTVLDSGALAGPA